jgi:negative regulator of flagellin synthesis FlgM
MAIEYISGSSINRSSLPANTVSKDQNTVTQQTESSSTASDTVALTNTSQGLQSIVASAKGTNVPTVNEERVAAIKTAIQNGSYSINAGRIAEKMLQFDQQLPNST